MKRLKKMLALLVVLGLFVGGYYAVSGLQESGSVSQTLGEFALGEWTQESLTGLSWSNGNGTFSFAYTEGEWVNTEDAAFPVNQSALQNLADKLIAMKGTREITDVSDPGDYGLAEPVFCVTVTDDQGNNTVYAQGDETPFGDGYYLSVSGRNAIYTVETALDSAFDKTLTQLCRLEVIPSLDTVTRVCVSGAVDAAYDEAAGLWTDTLTGETLDTDAVTRLADEVQAIEWYAVTEASADEERLAAYGLDDAQAIILRVEGGEDAPLEIRIGSTGEDGNRYACLTDSTMVYLVEGEQLEEILSADMDTLFSRKPIGLGYESLVSAEFIWETGSLAISPDTENAESLWNLAAGLEGIQRVEAQASGSPVLTITYTGTDSLSGGISIYPYSVNEYLLPVTGTHAMLVSADEVDALVRAAKNM